MSGITLYVCENFQPDFERVLKNEEFTDIGLVSYPYLCERPGVKEEVGRFFSEGDASDSRNVILCGRFCPALLLVGESAPKWKVVQGNFCTEYLAGPGLLEYIARKGGYVLSPGWLKNWKVHLESAGFTRETARGFYQEICKELVLLEIGDGLEGEETLQNLQELSDYLELPSARIQVAPDYLAKTLKNLVLELRMEELQEQNSARLQELRIQNAEYAALLEVMQKVVSYSDSEESMRKVRDLFAFLFGAKEFHFYQEISPEEPLSEEIREFVDDETRKYLLQTEKDGFLIKVIYQGKVYGVLEVGDFLFPQYIDKYLNFGIEIAGIYGLVLANGEQYKKLVASEKAAEEANLAKSRFLANMSHEIRTPLNGIAGTLRLLEYTGLSKEQKEYLDTAIRSSDLLQRVIDDILEYSRLEVGKVIFEKDNFSFPRLLVDVKNLFKGKVLEKSLDFEILEGNEIPEILYGDSFRIKQILINLLGNAVKFTHEGKVWLQASWNPGGDGKEGELKFAVGDTGIGIAPEKLKEVFQFFSQADPSFTRKYGGSGLGLAISKGLVEQMQGSMWVESQLGKGSIFYFTVLLETGRPEEEKESVATAEDSVKNLKDSQASVSLLIAEDDETSRMIIKKIAERKGWQPVMASDGAMAWELFQEGDYDMVILDVQMPLLDGFAVTSNIREWERLKEGSRKTPVIALTGHAMRGDREKCLEAGMDDYLTKPLQVDTFYSMVEKYRRK